MPLRNVRWLNRWAVLAALLVGIPAATAGCVLNHVPDMRAQFDKLPIPKSYQLLAERPPDDPYPTLWGRDATLTRWYRSPLDRERTCDQLQAIFKTRNESRSETMCAFALEVEAGWRAGIFWSSPYKVGVLVAEVPPKAARPPGRPRYPQPPEAYTGVTVDMHDRD